MRKGRGNFAKFIQSRHAAAPHHQSAASNLRRREVRQAGMGASEISRVCRCCLFKVWEAKCAAVEAANEDLI